jgi:hypothetical protein
MGTGGKTRRPGGAVNSGFLSRAQRSTKLLRSGALLTRDRSSFRVWNDPGFCAAAPRKGFAPRRVREKQRRANFPWDCSPAFAPARLRIFSARPATFFGKATQVINL